MNIHVCVTNILESNGEALGEMNGYSPMLYLTR